MLYKNKHDISKTDRNPPPPGFEPRDLMSVEFIGGLPESLIQGLLIGKFVVGGLGVLAARPVGDSNPRPPASESDPLAK